MLLTLAAPTISRSVVTIIRAIHAEEGAHLSQGVRLLDFSADLGGGMPHDCPPISHYRIVLRDRVWLRRLLVGKDDQVTPGAVLALFSTERHEPLDTPPVRAARVTVAGIIHHDGWWDAR